MTSISFLLRFLLYAGVVVAILFCLGFFIIVVLKAIRYFVKILKLEMQEEITGWRDILPKRRKKKKVDVPTDDDLSADIDLDVESIDEDVPTYRVDDDKYDYH